jgi:hypothetical protein
MNEVQGGIKEVMNQNPLLRQSSGRSGSSSSQGGSPEDPVAELVARLPTYAEVGCPRRRSNAFSLKPLWASLPSRSENTPVMAPCDGHRASLILIKNGS